MSNGTAGRGWSIPAMMAVGGVAAVLIVITTDPALIRFSQESVFDLAGTLAPFVVLALLIERATEVIVSGARLQAKVTLKADMATMATKDAKDQALRSFKTTTRKTAFMVSFIAATLLATAGARIISAFLGG